MNNFEFAKSIGFIDEKSMMEHSWEQSAKADILAASLGFRNDEDMRNHSIVFNERVSENDIYEYLTYNQSGKVILWDNENFEIKEEFSKDELSLSYPEKYIALEENRLINFAKELGFADKNALMDHSVTIGTIYWSRTGDGPFYGDVVDQYNHYMTVKDTGNIVVWDNKDFQPAPLQNSSPETICEYLDNQKSYLEKYPEDGVINQELDKDLAVFLGKVNEIHWTNSPHNLSFPVAMDARSEFFDLPAYDPKLLDFGDSKMIDIQNKLDLVKQYETNKPYALNLSQTALQNGFIDLKDMFDHTLPRVAEIKTPEGIKYLGFSLSETSKEVCVWDLQSGSTVFAKPCASFDQACDFIKAFDHGDSLSEKTLNDFCSQLEIKPAFSMER